jgi:hypothetical protein
MHTNGLRNAFQRNFRLGMLQGKRETLKRLLAVKFGVFAEGDGGSYRCRFLGR